MKNALVIGLGHFGLALVEELAKRDCELIVLEENRDKAELIKDLVHHIVISDATNKDLLQKYVPKVDCVIVCLGKKIDSSILITYYLKEIGAKKIYAKASSKVHGEILKAVGADEILYPEQETARRLAVSLVSPDILDIIKLSEDFEVVEISVPDEFLNKTIRELSLRNKFGIEVLAIKNVLSEKISIMPSPDYQFHPDDIMVVIGGVQSIEKLKFNNP